MFAHSRTLRQPSIEDNFVGISESEIVLRMLSDENPNVRTLVRLLSRNHGFFICGRINMSVLGRELHWPLPRVRATWRAIRQRAATGD